MFHILGAPILFSWNVASLAKLLLGYIKTHPRKLTLKYITYVEMPSSAFIIDYIYYV